MINRELELKNKTELTNTPEKLEAGKVFAPNVDIFESKDALHLVADMPGVSKENVHISLKDGHLTLEGKVEATPYEKSRPIYCEYNIGHYKRSFHLGEDVDQNRIEAKMDNGILTLSFPKREAAKPRTITVL